MMRDVQQIFSVILSCSIQFLVSSTAHARTAQEIARTSFPSTVLIVTHDRIAQPLAQGSGFFIRNNIVATNLHVMEYAASSFVKIPNEHTTFPVDGIVAADRENDLILLRIGGKANAKPLKLSKSKKPEIGEAIYVLSNPLGLEGILSTGIVSGFVSLKKVRMMQITAPISPGSSGGAVLNSSGEVIGVATASFIKGQNLNFAISVDKVVNLLTQVQKIKPLGSLQDSSRTNGKGDAHLPGNQFQQSVAITHVDHAGGLVNFSILNKLERTLASVRVSIIFEVRGQPVGFKREAIFGPIPPSMALRSSSLSLSIPSDAKVTIRVTSFTLCGTEPQLGCQ